MKTVGYQEWPREWQRIDGKQFKYAREHREEVAAEKRRQVVPGGGGGQGSGGADGKKQKWKKGAGAEAPAAS